MPLLPAFPLCAADSQNASRLLDPPAGGPAEVLLVDDDVELTAMLAEYLEGEAFAVTAVHDGGEVQPLLARRRFDLAVLDVMLPGLGGLDLLRALRRQGGDVPVIMLTARSTDVDRVVGLELGADDYVTKPFNPRELAARMNAVLRRYRAPGPAAVALPAVLTVGPLQLHGANQEVELDGEPVRLTATELRLLEVLMRSAGRVVPRDVLTQTVLGRIMSPYDRSLDTHASSLRRKLGLNGRVAGWPELRSARGVGYILTIGSAAPSA